jgi:hypothetical protein
MDNKLSRNELIQDIQELSHILETAHPDPYIKGGGKIAYHRRLQALIREIPDSGMTRTEFLHFIMPFIASLKDGHTNVLNNASIFDNRNPGGIPLIFGAIEGQLYVKYVIYEEHKPLIGCILVAIEGVLFNEIMHRLQNYIGCDNRYQSLGVLGSDPAVLLYRETLKHLIPEWNGSGRSKKIRVTLMHPDGAQKIHEINTAANLDPPITWITKYPFTRIEKPSHLPQLTNEKNKHFFYHFFDPRELSGQRVVLLRITNMMAYREAFENWQAQGTLQFTELAQRLYRDFNHTEPPDDYDETIAGIPSATDTFIELFERMKKERAQFLIVDLRDNQGGYSLMNQIFTYFLVGFKKTVSLAATTSTVCKLSEFRDKFYKKEEPLKINAEDDRMPIAPPEYDFSLDPAFVGMDLEEQTGDEITRYFHDAPSFYGEFQSRQHEAVYFPEKIFILSSEHTFSTGYNLMADLHQLGGEIVGVPSGLAGNSCGDVRFFELGNSKIKGSVSTKSFTAFPDDPRKGELLEAQYPLTYEKLKAYDFDENSTLRYALEMIEK